MLRYEIVSDKAGKKALTFFWMNEADGEIVVKRLLSESSDSSFTVSLCICCLTHSHNRNFSKSFGVYCNYRQSNS